MLIIERADSTASAVATLKIRGTRRQRYFARNPGGVALSSRHFEAYEEP